MKEHTIYIPSYDDSHTGWSGVIVPHTSDNFGLEFFPDNNGENSDPLRHTMTIPIGCKTITNVGFR